MANVLLVNGSPTQGGTDGTLVSVGNPVAPDLLTTGNDAETAPYKLAIRTNPGYERTGPSAVTPQGANVAKWALAADSNGSPGAWGAWGAPLTLSPTLRATNLVFWAKARVTEDESYPTLTNDISVTLSLPDDAYLLVAVGRSLGMGYSSIVGASRALGMVYTVTNVVGRSLDQPSGIIGAVGRSLAMLYLHGGAIGLSLQMPSDVHASVGRSLAMPSGIITTVARSFGMPYQVGQNPGIYHFTVGVNPIGLAEDSAGNVWVAAFGDQQLQRVTPAGVVTTYSMPSGESPIFLVSDGTNIWASHSSGLTKVSTPTGTPSLTSYAIGGTLGCYGMVIASDGFMYATNGALEVKKIDISGTPALVTAWGSSGIKSIGSGSLRSIVQQGSGGDLFVTNRTDRQLVRVPLANATAMSTFATMPDTGADIMDLVYNGTDFYMAGQGTGKIYRVTAGASVTGTLIDNAGSLPTGIAIGADGRVYTAGYAASYKNIYSIAAGATPGTPTNHGALTAAANWDVLGHSNGTIWVAEYGSAKVAKLVL